MEPNTVAGNINQELSMALKVCILAYPNAYNWSPYYVEAFRVRCDVLTLGPRPDRDTMTSWGRGALVDAVTPNDIEVDFNTDFDMLSLLPTEWIPDLVVGIAPMGGLSLYASVAVLPCPTVFISIDTWQCLMDYAEAVKYDFVFVAQREFIPHMRATGSRNVFWLPLACQPAAHHPVDVAKDHDITFVGLYRENIHRERAWFLEQLGRQCSLLVRDNVYGEETCEIFSRGRLAFNHCAVSEVNMRVFEAMAMGCALLTNRNAEANGLFDLFEDTQHLIAYETDRDLLDKAHKYLDDDPGRESLAKSALQEVLARHTYGNRVDALLQTVRKHYPGLGEPVAASVYNSNALEDFLPLVPGKVVDLAKGEGSDVDTVLIAEPSDLNESPGQLLDRAHAMLTEGGSVVIEFANADLAREDISPNRAGLERWMLQHNFHAILKRGTGRSWILVGRKRTRTLVDTVTGVFADHPEAGIDPAEIAARMPPDI